MLLLEWPQFTKEPHPTFLSLPLSRSFSLALATLSLASLALLGVIYELVYLLDGPQTLDKIKRKWAAILHLPF